ncbi:Inositol 2-dehydrogenase/D-chiro-inositol 3-dehydrogenase [subsurface metagenome]
MNNQKMKGKIDSRATAGFAQTRRSFLHSAAAAGAGLALSPMVLGQTDNSKKPDDINVALLGCGAQGRVLMNVCLKIPGIRFKAVCDIWTTWNQKRFSRILKTYKHEHNTYVDYEEMLDKEEDLDAVIIATPDFWHAEHTVACLKAGLHVYCEKEMSNTLEGARGMAQAAKETGRLLQIGHQRRSNPRYIFCYEKLLKEAKLLGQITAVTGQWNRSARGPLGWPKKAAIDQAILEKYGYKSMHQFKNWRWYKGLGGGPIVDLGSHQIDVYNWFLEANPKSVMASGRTNYYDKKTHEWYDTVMAVYEYETVQGQVSAYYQTISANSSMGYFETFMGDKGTLVISEVSRLGEAYREPRTDPRAWAKWVRMGYLKAPKEIKDHEHELALPMYIDESPPPFKLPPYKLPLKMNKLYHQPHLENFFDAIRGKAKLNCPAEIGYETAVAVLKVNEAAEAERKLNFKPEEFKA